jgi:ABC-type multidrug transport system fused ATPase/permease subunit
MTTHIEDDVPSANLMDRDVAKLLFSYLFRYRGSFAVALLLVAVITGTKLVVPWLSARVIDRSLVKTGLCVHVNRQTESSPTGPAFTRLLTKAKNLDDTTLFLFQPQLLKLSKNELLALRKQGVLSTEPQVLVQADSLAATSGNSVPHITASRRSRSIVSRSRKSGSSAAVTGTPRSAFARSCSRCSWCSSWPPICKSSRS